MPRHKLPDGWRYDEDGHAVQVSDEAHHVIVDPGNGSLGEIVVTHKDNDLPRCLRADVVLPLLRNAGLDPVYEVVKRMLESFNEYTPPTEIYELQTLIESLEDP